MIALFFKKHIAKIIIYVVVFAVGGFAGYTFCKRAQYSGVIKQQTKDAISVLEHQEKKDVAAKEIIKYIEIIKKVPDISGCLTKPSSDEYLNSLQRAISATESQFN